MANKVGKESHKGATLHHLSFQKLTLCPFLTTKENLELTRCSNFLIAFHRRTLYLSLTFWKHHPAHSSPYFPFITWFQNVSFSFANRQLHLPRRALLSMTRLFTFSLPFLLSRQIVVHLTKWGFLSRAPPPHRKSLWICSNNHSRQMEDRHTINWQTG